MKKWEYKIIDGKYHQEEELLAELNKLGNEGWEAVNMGLPIFNTNTVLYSVLLKREIIKE